jgi:hypothetical protein
LIERGTEKSARKRLTMISQQLTCTIRSKQKD